MDKPPELTQPSVQESVNKVIDDEEEVKKAGKKSTQSTLAEEDDPAKAYAAKGTPEKQS